MERRKHIRRILYLQISAFWSTSTYYYFMRLHVAIHLSTQIGHAISVNEIELGISNGYNQIFIAVSAISVIGQ